MTKCPTCLKTDRQRDREIKAIMSYLTQCLSSLEQLLPDTTEPNSSLGRSDHEDTEDESVDQELNKNDNDDETDNKNDSNEEEHRSDGVGFLCPEIQCRDRKPDSTFKAFCRHSDTHVTCDTHCPGCNHHILSVSILKRHLTTCSELKKKQLEPERQKMKEQSRVKSMEAFSSLKRRYQPDVTRSQSRKKPRSQALSDDALFNCPAPTDIDHSANGHDNGPVVSFPLTNAQNMQYQHTYMPSSQYPQHSLIGDHETTMSADMSDKASGVPIATFTISQPNTAENMETLGSTNFLNTAMDETSTQHRFASSFMLNSLDGQVQMLGN